MPKSVIFSSESLYKSACFYAEMGWSVIPLHGDQAPEKAKAAAVPWTIYQRERASVETLAQWFLSGQFSSLGIVCGAVSGLVVLDFDDAAFAAAFAQHCPDLTETFTVRSGGRSLPHYYYAVDNGTNVLNKRLNGADLQAKGRYVVAAPSVIAGKGWQVVNGAAPLRLGREDARRIETFLETYAYIAEKSGEIGPETAISGDLTVHEGSYSRAGTLSAEKAIRWYQGKARRGSRNEALFATALYAREYGWTLARTVDILGPVHGVQKPLKPHRMETVEQRLREAEKTIASAYQYRLMARKKAASQHQLPNQLRERLLQLGMAPVARVLEGLLIQGITAGKVFTERSATAALSVFGIGRRSVLKALEILRKYTHKTTDKNNKTNKKQIKKCLFVTSAKRIRMLKTVGQPPRYYQMPEMLTLCRFFDVDYGFGDALPVAALRSPKAYREALHAALFARRPGQYSRGWLAARLGVSVWTSRRYDRGAGAQVQARYAVEGIHWGNVATLGDVLEPARGVFLEAPTGERYPPLRGIAHRLLRRFHQVLLKRRTWNYYAVGVEIAEENTSVSIRNSLQVGAEKVDNRGGALPPLMPSAELDGFWLCPDCLQFHICAVPPETCGRCGGMKWQLIPREIWEDVERCKVWWGQLVRAKRAATPKPSLALRPAGFLAADKQPVAETLPAIDTVVKPLPSLQEYTDMVAETLYQRVYAMSPDHSLSRTEVQRLIDEFGVGLVHSVAGKLLGARLDNAAAFVIRTLRDMARPDNVANNSEAFIAAIRESGFGKFMRGWEG